MQNPFNLLLPPKPSDKVVTPNIKNPFNLAQPPARIPEVAKPVVTPTIFSGAVKTSTPSLPAGANPFNVVAQAVAKKTKGQVIETYDAKNNVPYKGPGLLKEEWELSPGEVNVRVPFSNPEKPKYVTIPSLFGKTYGGDTNANLPNQALSFIANIPSDVITIIPRAAVTLLEEGKNFGNPKTGPEKLSPFMARLYGSPEYETVNADINRHIAQGDGVLSSYMRGISDKTLDVAIGGAVLAQGFRLTSKLLSKGGDLSVIEAYKMLGSPSTEAEYKQNYRKLIHQFSADKTGGTDAIEKIINGARATIDKKGIQAVIEMNGRTDAASYLEWVSRETNVGDNIFRPDLGRKVIQPTPLPTKALPGYRPENPGAIPVGLSTERVEPVGFGNDKTPAPKVTTSILENLRGRSTVSRQFILDLTNSGTIKQAEREIIRRIVGESPEGDIKVPEFIQKVERELMPLDRRAIPGDFQRYEGTTLPNDLRGEVTNYSEHVYDSPISTSAGKVHFASADPTGKYFAHTRIEDVADNTRRVIEIQSDLMQKGGLEGEQYKTNISNYSGSVDDAVKRFMENRGIKGRDLTETEITQFKDFLQRDAVELKRQASRAKEIAKLEPYRNTWQDRIIREEIRQADLDGMKKLQFPTGETAMKIEGLGSTDTWRIYDEKEVKLIEDGDLEDFSKLAKAEDLKIGQRLVQNDGEGDWVVTEVIGNGKFKAVQKSVFENARRDMPGIDERYRHKVTAQKVIDYLKDYPSSTESFDISGKVDTSNPIYRFYEKEVGRFLHNKYGAVRITDKQGVSWYEINVPKGAGKQPVIAFKKKPIFSKLPGGAKITIEEAKKIIYDLIPKKDVQLIFEENLIGDGLSKATGQYESAEQLVNKRLKPIIRLYEEGGKVSASVTFHEAGHYMFDNFLTEAEQATAYKLAEENITLADKLKYRFHGYKGEDIILEEYLMDKFAEQAAKEAGFKGPYKTFFEKLDKIIRGIIEKVKKVKKAIDDFVAARGGGNRGFVKNPLADEGDDLVKVGENISHPEIGKIEIIDGVATIGNKKGYGLLKIQGDHPDVLPYIKEALRTAKIVEKIPQRTILQTEGEKSVRLIVDHQLGTEPKTFLNNAYFVLREGIEPPTPGASNLRSTAELPKHGTSDRSRTDIPSLERSNSGPLNYGGNGSIADNGATVNPPDEDDFFAPKKPADLRTQLEQSRTELEIKREAVSSHPAKDLARFANKNGELPEVVEGGKSIFGKDGDQMVTKLGFTSSEEARNAYQDYLKGRRDLVVAETDFKNLRQKYREQLALDKDVISTKKFLQKVSNKSDKEIDELSRERLKLKQQRMQERAQARKEVAHENLRELEQSIYQTIPESIRETPQYQGLIGARAAGTQFEDIPSFDHIVIDVSTPVKQKVGLHDILRTPDRVLKKIGLGREARMLRIAHENIAAELPQHMDLIREWITTIPQGQTKLVKEFIFDLLDGKPTRSNLTVAEKVLQSEVDQYFKDWADRLNMPEDQRLTHYITHLFERNFIQKEFDEDIAKIIRDKVPGSVYDPFLEKRLGKRGYLKDPWKAIEAYAKRAVRKVHMDPVLKEIEKVITLNKLEDSQFDYLKSLADRINLRPTKIDNALDNTIKQIIGYKLGARPTTVLTRAGRKMVYRAMLGLNVGSALKNLSQGVNTFAKLGTRWTAVGYIKALTTFGGNELTEAGILTQDAIQDRTLSAVRRTLEKLDKGLFVAFDTAEYINRASAYYGAKAKAISQGLPEHEAITFAKKMVRDTQFQYGSIDTPLLLSSDISKTILQFGSYSAKQTEFLAEMIQNKEWAGLLRYVAASVFLVYTVGKVFNIDGSTFNPLTYIIGENRLGKPPLLNLPIEILKALFNSPGYYGQPRDIGQKVKDVSKTLYGYVPGGVQFSKTQAGISAYNDPKKKIVQSPGVAAKAALLGPKNLPSYKKPTVKKKPKGTVSGNPFNL